MGIPECYSFTPPELVFMILRWKMRNRIATGTVISIEAASFSGNWFPDPSCPEARAATPLVSTVRSGLWVDTMKWFSSFQEPWKDMMKIVTSAGRAIGSTTDQKMRKVPAPSIRAAYSIAVGIDSKKFFMMKTPAASTSSGMIITL